MGTLDRPEQSLYCEIFCICTIVTAILTAPLLRDSKQYHQIRHQPVMRTLCHTGPASKKEHFKTWLALQSTIDLVNTNLVKNLDSVRISVLTPICYAKSTYITCVLPLCVVAPFI